MNKNDLGFTLRNANQEPILQIEASVVHGVDPTRKTDLEVHARPLLNGWCNGRISKTDKDTIRIAVGPSFCFRRKGSGIVYLKNSTEEQPLDAKSAEVVLCIMEQVDEQLRTGRHPPPKKGA